MSNVTDGTCPPKNYIPELASLAIPDDIHYVITPGQNVSDAAMVACCSPNAVNVAASCYLWCEVPSAFEQKDRNIMDDFKQCLSNYGENVTIIAEHNEASPARRPTVAGLMVIALAISTLASI